MNGTLYVVATPIGNLSDISFRAIEVLREVDIVLCEDTRITRRLLDRYTIDVKTMSYHQHSSDTTVKHILSLLADGLKLALVTDAGTPGISDPGNKLIQEVVESGEYVEIIPIPGASACITALSISGFPTDKFVFMGFPPHKKGRKKYFTELAESKHTVAFYESNHRIKKTLGELHEVLSESVKICVCRELTKKFESIYRGTISEINEMDIPEKGEFVVIVSK